MKRLSIQLMALLSLGFLGLATPSASAAVVPGGVAIIGAEAAGASTEQVQYYEARPRRYYAPRRYGPRPATRAYRGPVPYGEVYDPCKRRIQQWNGYRYIVRRVRVC